MRFCLLLLILSFISFKSTVATTKSDSAKIYHDIATIQSLLATKPDSAKILINELEEFSKETNSQLGIGTSKLFTGILKKEEGDFAEALDLYNEAFQIFSRIGNDKFIAGTHVNIGGIYLHLGSYDKALEHIHKALSYYEKSGELFALAGIYLNLSGVYITLGEKDQARTYIIKSIEANTSVGNKWGIAGGYVNLGHFYLDVENYEKSIEAFAKAKKLSKEIGYPDYIFSSISNIGLCELRMRNLEKAEEHFREAIKIKGVNKQSIAEAYTHLGELYQEKEELNKALQYMHMALKLSDSIDASGTKQKVYEKLVMLYENLGNYKKAYQYKAASYLLKDSLLNAEKTKQIKQLEVIYEVEKKQQKIESLSRENQINKLKARQSNIILIGVLILFVITGLVIILIIRQNKLKGIHEKTMLEQKLFRLQMNPHFIFNAISSIQNFIVKNNPIEAGSYLSNFAKLMRSILVNSREEFISLEKEVETLDQYLSLQKLRLGEKLEYSIKINDDIDETELAIPPMMIQPFIENSIEHGILKKDNGTGTIHIHIYKDNEHLVIESKDNGIGREKAGKQSDKNHRSLATEITKNRIERFSHSFKKKVQFQILDLKDDHGKGIGTKVVFSFPLMYL